MFFIEKLFTNPQVFFELSLIVVFSVCCHEFAHAWTALRQGDPTAAEAGHLTLNPMKQMGAMSLLMLALIGIAWGQVPVNPARMRHRWSHALVAFAGPAMNLLLCGLFALGCAVATRLNGTENAVQFFALGTIMNMLLFILNIMPVPPLDGWTVVSGLFPNLSLEKSEFLKGMSLTLFILIFVFISKLTAAAILISGFIISMMSHLLGLFS
jgi:Zn-dependent protease